MTLMIHAVQHTFLVYKSSFALHILKKYRNWQLIPHFDSIYSSNKTLSSNKLIPVFPILIYVIHFKNKKYYSVYLYTCNIGESHPMTTKQSRN